MTCTVQASSKLPAISDEQFDGWNTKADGSGTGYSAGTSVQDVLKKINGTSITLYAQKITYFEAKQLDNTFIMGKRDFLWPVKGYYGVSSCFYDFPNNEHKTPHYALDIYTGTTKAEVIAAYDGEVVKCVQNGVSDGGFGNYVIIKHKYIDAKGNKIVLYTRYNHLNDYLVKQGASVKAGNVIGHTGGSGYGGAYTYPVHLDFQILTSMVSDRNKNSIDPYSNQLLQMVDMKQWGNRLLYHVYQRGKITL